MIPATPRDANDFSRAGYRAILQRAIALGYSVHAFEDFTASESHPVLLLRHDLDHSLRAALPLAELETELGVRSTYFVQVTCDFYNLLGSEGRAVVARLVSLGHEVGLHYDARRYDAAREKAGPLGAKRVLELDVSILEDIAARPVISASQHLPSDTTPFDVLSVVRNEAYERRFISGRMTYVSDSLLVWRQTSPQLLLDRLDSFQFLAHPMKWAEPATSMSQLLRRTYQEECDTLRERYEEIEAYYADLLQRREQLDAAFREQRDLADGPIR